MTILFDETIYLMASFLVFRVIKIYLGFTLHLGFKLRSTSVICGRIITNTVAFAKQYLESKL